MIRLPIIAIIAAAAASLGMATAAHRMPEVYLTVEDAVVSGVPTAAVTVRLDARDALVIAADALGQDVVLDSEEALALIAGFVRAGIKAEGAAIGIFGTEVDVDHVFVYLTAPADISITRTDILSAVYEQWTNYLRDERAAGVASTQVFTQSGELQDHRH